MGLLVDGTPMTWEEIQSVSDQVRCRGALQFLNQYNQHKSRDGDPFLWGDEIEYILVKFDHDRKTAVVNLTSSEVLKKLHDKSVSDEDRQARWHPEISKYMVEGTPGRPYGMNGIMESLVTIETNMKLRRKSLVGVMGSNDHTLTIPSFPRDTKTPSPLRDDGAKDCCNDGANTETNLDFIHMDHTIYGSGCCCLQVTFQAKNLGEAKVLYDQLAPFCPIMLALSAGSPLWKGFVSDYDTRWPAFIQSLDDRTHEERRVKYGTRGHRSTRAGSVDCYLTSSRHNDKVSLYDEKVFTKLKSEGVDELLAKQISHEFIHDPITLYKECLEQEVRESDIFETVHSTNWRMLRLKLPIPEENTGWRIEFRPMDVQLTDYENAAYVVFVTLLTRVILEFNLDFTVPLSKVDFNMESASRRNAVLDEKFYFNEKVEGSCPTCGNNNKCVVNNNDDRYILMTIDEIMHGKDSYQGIIFYMKKYLKNTNHFNKETEVTVMKYLDLISDRTRGTEKTRARWIRDFVDNHPNYQHDSVVSDVINYDLLVKCAELSNS